MREFPPRAQDEVADAIIAFAASDGEPEPIDPTHWTAVLRGLDQARRREFATDKEVEAAFRRFGL